MDMSSFPKMLKFKQKDIPHPQQLRWSEWFSKYSFDVKHIKGKTNVLADILSRPFENFMIKPSSSKSKKNQPPPSSLSIPYLPNSHPEHPPEVLSLIMEKRFHKEARNMMLSYQLTWTNSQENTSPMEVENNIDSSRDGLEQTIEHMEIKCYRAKEEKEKMIEELNLTSNVSTDYESN
ncbi:hypothetical protein Gotri_000112 [Gossypium trilobum]|uniref:Reverse transcriptase RNase H-like domain-containing protein n=2 Tax=Gossypium trilobum TaxID=34281 RepID=A0A7J9FSX3_9ROSI|nr:hypothetical protein [Gossypium trilobum]